MAELREIVPGVKGEIEALPEDAFDDGERGAVVVSEDVGNSSAEVRRKGVQGDGAATELKDDLRGFGAGGSIVAEELCLTGVGNLRVLPGNEIQEGLGGA